MSKLTTNSEKKRILVIGATGAQGLAVIDALLAPSQDGSPSPYVARALTRDPNSKRAKSLEEKGVEIAKGSFEDFPAVFEALKDCYGAWVNTDGFTVGEQRELFAGMRIFELAKQLGTIRHYIYSNLDSSFKKGNYNPDYKIGHYDGKGRVAEWMKAQPSDVNDSGMTWSVVTTGPYMDMLNIVMFGPLNRRPDGTFVFASPIGDGHVPMIALADLGYFARYSFDHRAEVSGKDLEIATEVVGWEDLVKTFTRVTGQKAVFLRQTIDEWMNNLTGTEKPVAHDTQQGSLSWKDNFSGFWRLWRDDIIKRDMTWIRSINPHGLTLEKWMRDTKYKGKLDLSLLKNSQDYANIGANWDRIRNL